MLLQQIVETLDVELDRLLQLRAAVAALHGSVPLVPDQPEIEAAAKAPEPEAKTESSTKSEPVKQRRVAGAPRTRIPAKRKETEESALQGRIPAGPVLVKADAVARYHAAKKATKLSPKLDQPMGTLGAMIKAMHLNQPS